MTVTAVILGILLLLLFGVQAEKLGTITEAMLSVFQGVLLGG
jgi:hypothetical protein